MSTFGSFEVGRTAIHTMQKGAQVTGQNISNVNTEGYSRQMPNLKALTAQAVAGTLPPPGYGVAVADITRLRSEFYSDQLRKALNAQHYWSSREEALTGVEVIFHEPEEVAINAYLSEFFDAWQDLSVNPESFAARISLREQAVTLTGIVNDIYQRLDDFKMDIEKEAETNLNLINSFSREIAELNHKIVYLKSLGKTPNEMLDERDLLLQKLSELLNIHSYEKTNGAIEVLAGGRPLVHDANHFKLELRSNEQTGALEIYNEMNNKLSLEGGKLKGLLESYNHILPHYQDKLNEMVFTLVTEVNALHRLAYGLDGSTGVYFFEPWKETMPGDVVIDQATMELNDEILRGLYYGNNLRDNQKLLAGNYNLETEIAYTELSTVLLNDEGRLPTYSLTGKELIAENGVEVVDEENDLNASILFEVTALDGDDIYVNYTYHLSKINMDGQLETRSGEGVKRLRAGEQNSNLSFGDKDWNLKLDLELEAGGHFSLKDKFVVNVAAAGDDGETLELKGESGDGVYKMVLGSGHLDESEHTLRFFQLDVESGESKDVSLTVSVENMDNDAQAASFYAGPYQPEDLTAYYTRASAFFKVSNAVLNDVRSIAASTYPDKAGDGSNALAIARLRDKQTMTDGTFTFHDYFRGFIADLGVEGRESQRMYLAMSNVADKMLEQNEMVASVSLDDEMLNMVQFQHAYNAAARYLNTIDQMLQVLLSELGR